MARKIEPVALSQNLERSVSRPKSSVLTWLTVLFALAVTALALARPALKWWKESRISSLTAKAQRSLAEGDMTEAATLLSKANTLNPTDPTTLRMCARLLSKTGGSPEQALSFWLQLDKNGLATSEDRAEMGVSLLLAGHPKEARAKLESIPEKERNTRPVFELKALLHASINETREAEATLRRALELEPDNPQCQLRLALMDIKSPQYEVEQKAVNDMLTIARGSTLEATNAMSSLANYPALKPDMASELFELSSKNPKVSEGVRYKIATAFLTSFPKMRSAVLLREIARGKKRGLDDSVELVHWLATEGEYGSILELIPQEKASRLQGIFLPYAEALAAREKWQELNAILRTSATLPVSSPRLCLLRAACAKALNEPEASVRNHLAEAMRQAVSARDLEVLLRSASIAEGQEMRDTAVAGLRHAAEVPQFKVPALNHILQLQKSDRDLPGMLATLEQINATSGKTPQHIESFYYLKLLLGTDLETVMQQCSEHLAQGMMNPKTYNFLDALCHFRNGEQNQARQALTKVDVRTLPPGQRAVYSGILAECGEAKQGYEIAEKIPSKLLLEAEKKFLLEAL